MKRIQLNFATPVILILLCVSFFTATAQNGCTDATVIDTSEVCYAMGMPGVYCGCDGNVYSSECEAYFHHGVLTGTWSMDGSCAPAGGCKASFVWWETGNPNEVSFYNTVINTIGVGTSSWDFGDGGTSTDYDPTHTFPASGSYNVCLTISVSDTNGTACTDIYCETVYVGMSPPCIDSSLIDTTIACYEIYAPVCGCDGVTYENDCVAQAHGVLSWFYGECYPNQGCYAYFSYYPSDTTGMVIDFLGDNYFGPGTHTQWNFGDGTAPDTSGGYVQHQYATTGLFTVCLSIYTDDSSCTDTYCTSIPVAAGLDKCVDSTVIDTTVVCDATVYDPVCGNCDGVTYNSACEAYYHHGVVSWFAGECYPYYTPCDAKYYYWLDGNGYTVNFQTMFADGTVPGDPSGGNGGTPSPSVSWLWEFGDGTTSTDPYPAHTYSDTSIHSYYVCLTVTDTSEPCSETFCDSVYVGSYNYGCYAGFGYSVNPDGTVTVYPDAALANVPGWYWDGTGNMTPNGNGFSFVVDSTSNDTLCIILVNDLMNCLDTFCIGEPEMYMAFLLSGYGNAAHETLKKVALYPNPANGDGVTIELTMPSAADVSIAVRDLPGNELYFNTTIREAGINKISINTSQLPSGIYIVEVSSNGQSVFKKLVIAK